MFQDIAPHKFNNQFTPRPPRPNDLVMVVRNGEILLARPEGEFIFPDYEKIAHSIPVEETPAYLFSVDSTAFYLSLASVPETAEFRYHSPYIFRKLTPQWLAFAGASATHLAHWYDTRRFCGRCGMKTRHKTDERAVTCPICGLVEYPKIAPVVIVAVTDGDRILLTKNAAGNYRRHSLVAGYVEIGETLEDAARREVLEEVGVRIKNIHYFASQPWAFSSSILTGFFAELDGSPEITMDTRELAEAEWFSRKNIPQEESNISLTWTMINAFRNQG